MWPNKIRLAVIPLSLLLVLSCVTTPVTNREALILIPYEQELSLGKQAFKELTEKEKESADPRLNELVRKVARRIAAVSDMPDLEWEFKLIDSPVQNAFCAPGGKVVVYTGILPPAANEAGLAAILGHEVAHAIARHGAQRMSQQLILTGILATAAISLENDKDHDLIMATLGLGATYGAALPFSRMNESEADEIGLVYMARAGYDPNEAVNFWKRFAAQKGPDQTAEFLSTHPSDETRIKDLQKLIPNAIKEYDKSMPQYGLGESFR
ncbi:MAG: M48 family metallopeptidase [Nitrospinae bacterium]|nr:M48 family metallopeptidase [Nitrospinota bacterium]